MRFPFPTATLLCALLLSGTAHAEQTACERFKQQYTKQYAEIDCVDKNTAVVSNQQNELALTDSQNRLLVPFGTYHFISTSNTFSQNGKLLLNVIAQDGKEGVIDHNGKQIVPPQYDNIQMPKQADEPIFIIQNSKDGERYGLADQTGKILLAPHYYGIDRFSEGLAVYTAEPLEKYGEKNPHARFGYLDTQGKTIITPQFANAQPFSADVAWVQHPDNGDWLLIDRTGKTLLNAPKAYQNINNFRENGLAVARKNNLYGLINKRGDSILAAEYHGLFWQDTEKFYFLLKDNKFGVANAQGKVVIAPEFDIPTDWNKKQTPQGQIALIRGFTVYLFDQNGTQLAQRPVRYAKQCAHIAMGLPHKTQAGYRVSKITADYAENNHIVFANAAKNIKLGECSDVAMPRKKGKKHRP